MSNDITNGLMAQVADVDLKLQEDGRTFVATVGADKFRFRRQTARARSSMLIKAAPMTKLVGSIFNAIRGKMSPGVKIEDLTDEDKMAFGAEALDALGSSLVDIDTQQIDNLIYELVSWADYYHPESDQYLPMSGPAYEQVLDRNLLAQVPILVGVVQANFLHSLPSEPNS